jgi:methionyl-tRNA formyltransferase
MEYRDQSTFGVSYAHKLEKSEAEIDWTKNAEVVRNQIHALSPAPGARSEVMIGNRKESIKFFPVWQLLQRTGLCSLRISFEPSRVWTTNDLG